MCEEVETVRGFCYLGDRVNTKGGCEAAVTARGRTGWLKFRECRELLNSKWFSLKMKGMVYRISVRLAMVSEGKEMAILRRNERSKVRATCGAKPMEKKRTEDLREILGFRETVVQMVKANGVKW